MSNVAAHGGVEIVNYRHAVTFRRSDGTPHPDSGRARELARDLLIEWAEARDGTPIGVLRNEPATRLHVEKWDYDRRTGYAMEFAGPVPDRWATSFDIGGPTRLTGAIGVVGNETLRDHEEVYVTDEDLSKPTVAETAYHGLRMFTG